MNILIFDENEKRHIQFTKKYTKDLLSHVYNVDECINVLEKSDKFDAIFMSDGGYEIALWFIENKKKIPNEISIHTLDSEDAKCVLDKLTDNGIVANLRPYLWKKEY